MTEWDSSSVDLHLGDCLEGMRELPAESVDLVFADPPFNIGKPYGGQSRNDRRADYFQWCNRWISEAFRILKPSGTLYLLMMSRHLGKLYPMLEARGVFVSHVNWRHFAAGHSPRRFWVSSQPILVYAKSKKYVFNTYAQVLKTKEQNARLGSSPGRTGGQLPDYWNDIPFVYAGARPHPEAILEKGTIRKLHPCQMPIDLPKRAIVFSTNPGDLVVEPFAGMAATAIACLETNRRYLGFEQEPIYVEAARARIAQAQMHQEPSTHVFLA
jgi:site-specific DNA-methyltransferase (adenine-specific)